MAEGMVRLIQETQADRPAFTDVIVASPNQIAAMVRAGALAPVDWASWAPNVQDPRATAPQGVAVAAESSVAGITYNSARVRPDEVPRSMEDLLKLQYKGRVASTPYAAHFNNLAASGVWGSARTLDYVRAFADQIAGLIRCNETGRIISGEFDLFALDCGHNYTLRAKDEGAPIDFVVAADAPLLINYYAAVPRNAAHPNAAQLWVNFLLSREAQDLLYQTEYLDLAYLPGSKTAKLVEQYEAAGVTFVPIDVEFYQRIDEQQVEQVLAEVQRLLRK
jgi:ABC-type Fe3+ transport system substrate-binding protein